MTENRPRVMCKNVCLFYIYMYLLIMNWGMHKHDSNANLFMLQIQSPVIRMLSYSKHIIQIDLMYGNK